MGGLLPLAGTLLAYEAGVRLQRRCGGAALANPVLVAVLLVTAGTYASGLPAAAYAASVQPLGVLLGPATVALGLPLYRCLPLVRRAALPVLASVAAGSVAAVGVVVAMAEWLDVPGAVVRAAAAKSVTAAVAMAVAPAVGGDPALAAGLAVMTGVLGGVIGTGVMGWCGVRDARARGLAMGVAAHGIGTARMLSLDAESGAFAGLALGVNGLLTGVVLPFCGGWLGG